MLISDMKIFRATVRLTFLLVFTLTSYSIYFVGLIVPVVLRITKDPWRNLFMRVWSWGACLILNIRVTKEGTPPDAPFFLVSNHLSYIDILPLFLHLKCTFVAKKEVRSWPLLGFMVMTTGVVFVDRVRKRDVKRVNKIISGSLNRHQGMIVFPEGTTSGGDAVLPFRPPLLQYPASTSTPVHYASIRYETDEENGDLPAEESVCFYGARDPFHKHLLKLAGNRRIDCTIRFGEKPVREDDRKILAEELQKRVNFIFEPME